MQLHVFFQSNFMVIGFYKTVTMGGRSVSIPLVLIVVVGICTTADSESVARLNVVFPQLDSSTNDQSQVSSATSNRSTATLSQSDFKIQKLHSEIKKLQDLVAKSFVDEKVTRQSLPYLPTTKNAPDKISTTPKTEPSKEPTRKKNSEQRSDGFDLKSLQREIELLQKQLIGDVDDARNVNENKLHGAETNDEKHNENVVPEIKLPENDPKSRQTNEGLMRNVAHPHYPYNYAYPYGYNVNYQKQRLKNEDSEESEDDASQTQTNSEQSFRFVGGKTKNIVLDLVLEVLKLVAGGDGKGIIGALFKLPPLIINGLLRGVVASLSKGGLRGLIVRFLVPLIVLVGVNVLVVFMAWWLWEDASCAKMDEIDSNPPTGYPSSLSELYGKH